MEETIQTAIKKGLSEICFTEHVDEDYPDTSIVFELDLPRYAKAIKDMQEKYRGQITIKKGIEIGVQPHLLDNSETLVKQNEFDFVICYMHTADKKDYIVEIFLLIELQVKLTKYIMKNCSIVSSIFLPIIY